LRDAEGKPIFMDAAYFEAHGKENRRRVEERLASMTPMELDDEDIDMPDGVDLTIRAVIDLDGKRMITHEGKYGVFYPFINVSLDRSQDPTPENTQVAVFLQQPRVLIEGVVGVFFPEQEKGTATLAPHSPCRVC
jgi:hypothetical protein